MSSVWVNYPFKHLYFSKCVHSSNSRSHYQQVCILAEINTCKLLLSKHARVITLLHLHQLYLTDKSFMVGQCNMALSEVTY